MKNKKFLLLVICLIILFFAAYTFIIKSNWSKRLYGIPGFKTSSSTIKGYKECISRWPSDLCKMFIPEERARLYAVCAQTEIPKRELDTGVYPKNKIARISWWDGELQQNVTLYLPYEPEIEFNGCSETAKATLRDVQTNIINQ